MEIKVAFYGATVKELQRMWRQAVRQGQRRLVLRISALLHLSAGLAVAEVGERVGVGESTVYAWRRAFLLDRFASLRYGASSGRPSKLTPTQKERLKALVAAGPRAAGYPTGCWSGLLLQDLIWREFGRLYNAHYVCTLLRNLGFSYQKARFVSDERDEERRRTWLHEEWPSLVRLARARGALLLFGDEASFAPWGSLSYTWAPRGQQPLVLTCGRRKAYKVFGLIDYFTDYFTGRLFCQGQTERFTAQCYGAFLRTVLATTTQPLILIQDGAKYHTAAATKEFKEFFAAQAERLTAYHLPSYSPDDNPIEHLWKKTSLEEHDETHDPSPLLPRIRLGLHLRRGGAVLFPGPSRRGQAAHGHLSRPHGGTRPGRLSCGLIHFLKRYSQDREGDCRHAARL